LAAVSLIVLGSLVFGPANPSFVFSEAPPFSVEWEVETFYNNHIGSRIGAILRITTVPGVRVNLANLPQVGDVVEIKRTVEIPESDRPAYSYPDAFEMLHYGDYSAGPSFRVIEEGELEVRDRRVTRDLRDGLVVTEVYYDFQYLLPIDFDQTFTLKVLPKLSVQQLFFLDTPRLGKTKRSTVETVEGAEFYVARRVDEESAPIFQFYMFKDPLGLPHYLRLAGVGILAGAVAAQIGVSVWRKKRAAIGEPISEILPIPTLVDLYIRWGRTGEYGVFTEAVRLYRAGTWGKPSPLHWVKSTFVLYSGVVLSDSKVANYFTKLMEVSGESAS